VNVKCVYQQFKKISRLQHTIMLIFIIIAIVNRLKYTLICLIFIRS